MTGGLGGQALSPQFFRQFIKKALDRRTPSAYANIIYAPTQQPVCGQPRSFRMWWNNHSPPRRPDRQRMPGISAPACNFGFPPWPLHKYRILGQHGLLCGNDQQPNHGGPGALCNPVGRGRSQGKHCEGEQHARGEGVAVLSDNANKGCPTFERAVVRQASECQPRHQQPPWFGSAPHHYCRQYQTANGGDRNNGRDRIVASKNLVAQTVSDQNRALFAQERDSQMFDRENGRGCRRSGNVTAARRGRIEQRKL